MICRHGIIWISARRKGGGIVVVAEQKVPHRIAGPAISRCVGATTTILADRVVIKTELTEKVVGKIPLLHPATIVETHRDSVPAVSHRKRIGKFPRWYVTGGNVIALTAERRAIDPLK